MGVINSSKKSATNNLIEKNSEIQKNPIKTFLSKVEVRPMTKSEIKAARINSYSSIY
jgi:hypothetical protein